jgi:hypothetical protein
LRNKIQNELKPLIVAHKNDEDLVGELRKQEYCLEELGNRRKSCVEGQESAVQMMEHQVSTVLKAQKISVES